MGNPFIMPLQLLFFMYSLDRIDYQRGDISTRHLQKKDRKKTMVFGSWILPYFKCHTICSPKLPNDHNIEISISPRCGLNDKVYNVLFFQDGKELCSSCWALNLYSFHPSHIPQSTFKVPFLLWLGQLNISKYTASTNP